jgi:hypothetical protein
LSSLSQPPSSVGEHEVVLVGPVVGLGEAGKVPPDVQDHRN